MPAINCHKCKQLISDKENECPFCHTPQRIERETSSLVKDFYVQPQEIVNWILGINILLYIASVMLDPGEALSFEGGLFGFGSPSSESLFKLGLTGGFAWNCNHWWTIFTASFLHGSLLHIYFNMSWLRQLGVLTVALLGPARLIFTYLITGMGGFLLSNTMGNPPTVGASCSIFGLMGLLIVFSHRRGGRLGQQLGKQLWIWTGIGLLFGFMVPMVNNAGHIGGLITGVVLGLVFPPRENHREPGWLQLLALLMLAGTILSVGWNGYVMSGILETQNSLGQIFCSK